MYISLSEDVKNRGFRIDMLLPKHELQFMGKDIIREAKMRAADKITQKIMDELEPQLEGLYNGLKNLPGNDSSSDNV